MKKSFYFAVIIIAVISAYFLYLKTFKICDFSGSEVACEEPAAKVTSPVKKDRVLELEIEEGDTYGKIMDEAEVDFFTATDIYEAAVLVYDLARIRSGRAIKLVFDKDSDELIKLSYQVDSEDELHVNRIKATTSPVVTATSALAVESEAQYIWKAEILPIPYQIKIKTAAGVVGSSMYQAALDNGIDIRAIIELANAFQWTIDFALDPRVGDKFKFIYEERYLDGKYVMPGQVLAGYYINDGQRFEVYYFKESEDNQGFFDQNGNSVQKMFLKAPVAYKYISSGYTTGPRYIPGFRMYTSSHRAIDYAAANGTPVRTVGDGTVTFTGWDNGYGRKISVHHNATYSTNYCHLSGYAVKQGQKVKQGDVIGYVGSTGLSTGPHLHYEMVKHGVKINPLEEVLPPGEPIKEENRERYFNEIKQWQELLK